MNIDFLDKLYKGFDEIIKEHPYDMLQLMIYYSCTCYQEINFRKFSIKEKQKILETIYNIYMKLEMPLDLGTICDVVMENSKEYLNEELNFTDLKYKAIERY